MSRLDRQGFLGKDSDTLLQDAIIGLVGLGGGGSHIVQQCSHCGVGGYVIVDPDIIDETNTNRLVGGTLADVAAAMPKVEIAARVVRGLNPNARITIRQCSWHDATDDLKCCDVIIGAVDSFKEREQLERFARRYLIPYIDIGMDVWPLTDGEYFLGGQVVLSTPGNPCLRCCGIITDERLQLEAQTYGAAGPRPQVVWPNGILASTAVGLLVQILTPWHRKGLTFSYLEYDGNCGTISVSKRTEHLKGVRCRHHPAEETGDPLFDIRAKRYKPAAVVSDGSVHLLASSASDDRRTFWRRLGSILSFR